MASLVLWIDSGTRKLVNGPNSNMGAEQPVLVQGDQTDIELHLLEPTGIPGSLYDDVDLGGASVKLAIGRVDAKPTGGSFQLEYGGATTPLIAFNATADAIQTALNVLSAVADAGGAVVQGNIGGPWNVYWNQPGARDPIGADPSLLMPLAQVMVLTIRPGDNALAAIQQVKLKQSPAAYQDQWADLPGPGITITRLVTGSSTASEVQRIRLVPKAYGGNFALRYGNQSTVPIAWNAPASKVQDAVTALSAIGANNAVVTDVAQGVWDIRFTGSLANAAQNLFTGEPSSILVRPGKSGTLSLNTPAVEMLLSGLDSIQAVLEIEVTEGGAPHTYLQTPCTILNDMIEGTPVAPEPFERAVTVNPSGQLIYPENFFEVNAHATALAIHTTANRLTGDHTNWNVGDLVKDTGTGHIYQVYDTTVLNSALGYIDLGVIPSGGGGTPGPTLKTGIVAYWPGDMDGNGSVTDVSGNNRKLDRLGSGGTPENVAGVVGTALQLGQAVFGSSDDALHVTDLSEFSFALWLRIDQYYVWGQCAVGGWPAFDSQYYEFIIGSSYASEGEQQWGFSMQNQYGVPASGIVNTGEWHFVAMRFNGSTASIKMDDQAWASVTANPVTVKNIYPFCFGGYPWSSPDSDWQGPFQDDYITLNQVGFWNRALSDDEINQLYNNGAGLNPFA